MAFQNLSEDESFDSAHREKLLRVVQSKNSGTLAELALRLHHEERIELEEREKLEVDAQKKASGKFAASFEESETYKEIQRELAEVLEASPFEDVWETTKWRMDPKNLAEAKFNTGAGVQGIESGNLRCASLFTEVVKDSLWLEVAPWGEGSVKPPSGHPAKINWRFYITTDIHNRAAAVPLRSSDQLGAAVAREVNKRLHP